MPLPLLFIGVAAATGAFGVGKTVKAGIDTNNAKQINKSANEIVENSTDWLNAQRLACGRSLSQLGEQKLYVLNSTMTEFLDCFQRIKNVDFKDTEGLDELKKMHIDEHDFQEMRTLVNFAGSLAGGAVAGTACRSGRIEGIGVLTCCTVGDHTVDAVKQLLEFRTRCLILPHGIMRHDLRIEPAHFLAELLDALLVMLCLVLLIAEVKTL